MGGIAPPSGQTSRHRRYRHGPFMDRRARINGQDARAVRRRMSLRRVCEPSESDPKDDAPIRVVGSRNGGTGSQLTREPWPEKKRGTPKRSRPSRGKQRLQLLMWKRFASDSTLGLQVSKELSVETWSSPLFDVFAAEDAANRPFQIASLEFLPLIMGFTPAAESEGELDPTAPRIQ